MQGMPQTIIVAHSSHNPKQKALDSLQQQHKPDIRLVAIWLKQRSQRKIGSCHFKDEERPYSSLPPACLHPQFALSQMKWKYFLNVVLILSSLYTDCQGCGCIPSTWGFLCLCSGPAQPGCMCLAMRGLSRGLAPSFRAAEKLFPLVIATMPMASLMPPSDLCLASQFDVSPDQFFVS